MKLELYKWTGEELMLTLSGVNSQMCFHFPCADLKDYVDSGRVQVKGMSVELSMNYRTGVVMWSGQNSAVDFIANVDDLWLIREQLLTIFREHKQVTHAFLKTNPR